MKRDRLHDGLRLDELARELPMKVEVVGDAAASVSGVRHDSREVKPGELFVARKGASVDGARFIFEAVANGVGKDKEALVRHLHHLVHGRASADVVQVAPSGESCRASRCATTRIVFSSPSDWISWIELFPPHRQRQHRVGKQHGVPHRQYRQRTPAAGASGSSPDFPAFGLITLTKSLAIECPYIRFPTLDALTMGPVATPKSPTIGIPTPSFWLDAPN